MSAIIQVMVMLLEKSWPAAWQRRGSYVQEKNGAYCHRPIYISFRALSLEGHLSEAIWGKFCLYQLHAVLIRSAFPIGGNNIYEKGYLTLTRTNTECSHINLVRSVTILRLAENLIPVLFLSDQFFTGVPITSNISQLKYRSGKKPSNDNNTNAYLVCCYPVAIG